MEMEGATETGHHKHQHDSTGGTRRAKTEDRNRKCPWVETLGKGGTQRWKSTEQSCRACEPQKSAVKSMDQRQSVTSGGAPF